MTGLRPWRPVALLLGLGLFLTGCAAGALNLITPRSGYEVSADIAYGEGERRRLDLYVPTDAGPATPLVVFVHGGSWDSGSKDIYRFLGQAFAAEGFILAVPNYRLYPQTRFPGFVEDAAQATAFIDEALQKGAYGVPAGSRPLFMMGHSAGAEIAALLAFDERYLAARGFDRSRISAFVGLSGPYDFLPLDEERYKRIFPEATRAASQPVNFVDAGAPASFLGHGTADTTVNPSNARSLAARLEAAGRPVELRFYEGIDHIGPIVSFANALPLGDRAIRDDVFAYLRERLR